MAVVGTGQTCKLQFTVATGTTSQGKTKYSTRTISYISPDATNAQIYSFGAGLATLQTHALGEIRRIDQSVLVDE